MELPEFILLITSLSILFISLFYYLYLNTEDNTRYRMNELVKHYSNKQNIPSNKMPYCPSGCVRGDCTNQENCDDYDPNNFKFFLFHLQCRNCIDKGTNNVYQPQSGDTEFIDENYTSTDPNTISKLNHEIRRQNEYIDDINNLVSQHNKPFFEQQQINDNE